MKKNSTLILLICFSFFAKAQTFSWAGYAPILDLHRDSIPIVVNGLPNAIDTTFGVAHICMTITHTFDNDLVIRIVSPNGDSLTLIQGIGGSADNFTGTCVGVDGTSFSATTAPYNGLFQPFEHTSLLNNGQNPNGTWYLIVEDVATGDTGSVHNASIEFTNNPPQYNGSGTSVIPTGVYVCPTCICPGAASTCDLLPDMISSAQEIILNHNEVPGALYISNATPNIGYGPMEIYGTDSCFCGTTHVPCGTTCPSGEPLHHVVKQRIYQKVPGNDTLNFYDRYAGTMTYHPQHGHIHVDNFVSYTLRTATSNPDATTWPIVSTGGKQSFCLINLGTCSGNVGECKDMNGNTITTVPNQGVGFHTGCGLVQGIFPGHYDVYSIGLNDPMPLANVCNGTYYIVSITDPLNSFLEMDETNNWVAVPITLTQQNASPLITPAGPITICQGDSVTLTANAAPSYLWSTGATTQSIVVYNSGTYTVSSDCGTSIASSSPVSVTAVPTNSIPSVSIALTAGSNPSCPGVNVTFTATPTNGGTAPSYQWKIDGVNTGTNSHTFTTANLTNAQVVSCEMIPNLVCLISNSATSNSITINVGTAVCYCIPVYGTGSNNGCLDGDVIARVQLNTLDNNSGTGCPGGLSGYSDYSSSTNPLLTTSLNAGSTYSMTVWAGQYGEGYRAWIDYNNDGIFSANESIGNTTAIVAGSGTVGVLGSSAVFPVIISCDATLGLHRMRVRCMYNATGVGMDPCSLQNSYGEAEDYTITLVASSGCPQPSAQTVVSTSSNSAVLAWTSGCVENLWNVHVTTPGGGAPTGTASNPNVTNPFTRTSLNSNTTYEYWVAANCSSSGNGTSPWTGPFLFTTLPTCNGTSGSTMLNPIDIGPVPCASLPYVNTQTNTLQNCFTNSYTGANNQAAPDVWYKFSVPTTSTVQISHCGSGFDTYLHLLNSSGTQIAFNDDNGPLCSGLKSSISMSLTPGIYYLVSEGYGSNTGGIITTIKGIDTCPVSTLFNLTCFIQGYWDGFSGMLPVLNNQGIPSTPTTCDSVTVQLRGISSPYSVLHSVKTILRKNGTVSCTFPPVTGLYYVVVKHRNALETWSANPLVFNTSPVYYNFSTANAQAFGSNQFEVSNGVWAFYSGDLNYDQNIDLIDAISVEDGINNFFNGYVPTDLNGDGNVDLLDNPMLETNISNFVFTAHP